MSFRKNISLFSILFLLFVCGCNNRLKTDTDNKNHVVKVESSMDGTNECPYIRLTYDKEGFLSESTTTNFVNYEGKTKLFRSNTCKYERSGRKIKIEGIREYIDTISDVSTNKEIKLEVELDKSGRVIKRVDYNSDYNKIPLVDIFEWDGDIIKRKRRFLEGDLRNGSFEEKTEYRYENGNIVEAITKTDFSVNNFYTNTEDTILFTYYTDMVNFSSLQFPDEYELSYEDISYFTTRHSKNQLKNIIRKASYNEYTLPEKTKISETTGLFTIFTTPVLDDKKRLSVREDVYSNKYTRINFEDTLQNKKVDKEFNLKFYYTYKD